jgi:anti-sigma factor RsiW
MSLQGENDDLIRRYLLGELSEDEREQFERRLMSEDDLYQQLLINEDELIDEYVSGTLPEHDRAKFSRQFLQVPELRQDIRFAVALRNRAQKAAPQTTEEGSSKTSRPSLFDWLGTFFMQPVLGAALATALLAVVLLTVWLAVQNSRLRQQVEQLQARQTPTPAPPQDLQEQLTSERLRNEQLSAELRRAQEANAGGARPVEEPQERRPTPKPTGESATFVAFTLTPGLSRGESEGWKRISLQPGVREARIRLDLPEAAYRSYRVTVRTLDGGREILQRQGLRDVGGKFVQLSIAAALLSPNDYEILLSGTLPSGETEEISRYNFRVLK